MLMDPVVCEGAEGRRRKKTKDPMYTGPIKNIDTAKGDPNTPGFKGGLCHRHRGQKAPSRQSSEYPEKHETYRA